MITYTPVKEKTSKMTQINQKIIDMIKQKKTIEEISQELNLSYKQIFNRVSMLENYGYVIKRKYDTNGILSYTLGNDDCYHLDNLFELQNNNNTFKIMVISDLHIGNIISDEAALNTIFDYCCKNSIHVIINCGDIIDGVFSNTQCVIPPEEQVEYLLKKYPFDKNIFTLYTLGDHDNSLYTSKKISLTYALKRRRHDICSIFPYTTPTQNCVIKLNNNQIMVSHQTTTFEENRLKSIKLHLVGHIHTSKTLLEINNSRNATPRIYVPSLCKVSNDGQINIPRALELTIYMDEKFNFNHISKKDLIILENMVLNVGETIINYSKNELNALDLDNNKHYVDDKANSKNKTEKKEIGVLNDEQSQKLKEFFKGSESSKKLEKMIKKSRKGKRKWQ